MLLENGKFGILGMCNTNTRIKRDMVMIYKGMDISGIISIAPIKSLNSDMFNYGPVKPSDIDKEKNYVFHLGYNELFIMDSKESAVALLNIITAIFAAGIDAEKAIDNMLDAVQNIFFQAA